MRSLAFAIAVIVVGALPSLANAGNDVTGSTGVVQVGPVTVSPTASVGTDAGTATATAPSGSTANSSGGNNTSSGSTGVVQTAPTSANPGVHVVRREATVQGSAPVSIGAGDNAASSSTGAAQIGGGNTASSSTGAAQVSGTRAAPSATATPAGGSPSTVGGTVGVDGSGNSADDATGAAQLGGGNTATGSTGTAQSGPPSPTPTVDLTTPPGLPTELGSLAPTGSGSGGGGTLSTLSLESTASPVGGGAGPVATAALTPVRAQAGSKPAAVRQQGISSSGGGGGTRGAAKRIATQVLSGPLPFTGLNLALWLLVGLTLVGGGAAMRLRDARAR